MDFLDKDSIQRIAEKADRLDSIKGINANREQGNDFSGQSDLSMHDEPMERSIYLYLPSHIVDEVDPIVNMNIGNNIPPLPMPSQTKDPVIAFGVYKYRLR